MLFCIQEKKVQLFSALFASCVKAKMSKPVQTNSYIPVLF